MNRTQHLLSSLALAALCATAGAAESGKFNQEARFQIAPQTLSSAVIQFSEQSGVQIVTADMKVTGLKTKGVNGKLSVNDALRKLLEGTGLQFKQVGETAIALTGADENKRADASGAPRLRLAQSSPESTSRDETESHGGGSESHAKPDDEVLVTGSRIARPASQVAANVIVMDAEALRATGESTLERALRQLPQNMLGATEVGATVVNSGNAFNGALNITGGSNINLRGLGSASTLVLVDGRRIGKSGLYGGASDISGIPLSSVERVEIMLDGASSIYGSDAVGGVVNIILKKDYSGSEASYQFGVPDEGGFEEHTATLSTGHSWGSGDFRGSLEFYKNTNLDGAERPQRIYSNRWAAPGGIAGTALFYTYNGQNYRATDLPGLGLTTTSPGVKAIGFTQLPVGYTGSAPLTLSQMPALINNSDLKEGMSLIPAIERRSVQAGFDQRFNLAGRELTLSGDIYYSDRNTVAGRGNFYSTFSLPASNPLNPFGRSATVYWEIPALGVMHWETGEKIARGNLTAQMPIGAGWSATLGAGKSRDHIDSLSFNVPNYSNPPGITFMTGDIVAANGLESLSRLVTPANNLGSLNEESTADISVNGPLFSMPGGKVHLAIGAEWRRESLRSLSEGSSTSQITGPEYNFSLPSGVYDGTVVTTQRSAYAELLVPIVGAGNGMPGLRHLTFTGTSRYDSYDAFGSDTTWSAGLVWDPATQVRLRVNRTTSFVTPTPKEALVPTWYRDMAAFYPDEQGYPIDLVDENGAPTGEYDYLGYYIYYRNPDLKSETAATWSAGIEFTPQFVPGLTLSATWHETNYNNRIVDPPDPEFIAGTDYVAKYPNLTRDPVTGNLTQDLRAMNAASVVTSGVDYQARYSRETPLGQFVLTGNVAYIEKFLRQDFTGFPRMNQVGDTSEVITGIMPRYRYAADLGWYRGGLSTNLDFSSSSKVTMTSGTTLREYTTALLANLSVGYDVDQGASAKSVPVWLRGTAVTFKILNVADDQPTSRAINLVTGNEESYFYNSYYGDPRGRMFYVNLVKRF